MDILKYIEREKTKEKNPEKNIKNVQRIKKKKLNEEKKRKKEKKKKKKKKRIKKKNKKKMVGKWLLVTLGICFF